MKLALLALSISALCAQSSFPPAGGGGGSGTPASPAGSVQFNNSGAFGGSASFTWDDALAGAKIGASTLTDPYYTWQDYSLATGKTFTAVGSNIGVFVETIYNPSVDDPSNNNLGGLVVYARTGSANTHSLSQINPISTLAEHAGSGDIGFIYGSYTEANINGAGNVTGWMYGNASAVYKSSGASGDVANMVLYYGFRPTPVPSRYTNTVGLFGLYVEDLKDTATNAYYAWYDSRGVGRCREDSAFDSVGQVICVTYNPQFAKYTPGAADFERTVYGRFNGNTVEIGAEKGGTGTLRNLKLLGANYILPSLTTGAAGSKHVVCIDTSTKQLYESSTATGCDN